MSEQSPIIPTIPPFFDDAAIAQTDNKAVIAVPTQPQIPQQPDNELPKIGSAAIGGAVVVTIIAKFFEKYGSNIVDGQKSRLDLELRAKELELEAEKAERLAARKEEERKAELIANVLNQALENVFKGSDQSRIIHTETTRELQENNDIHRSAFSDLSIRLERQNNEINARLDKIDQRIELTRLNIKDIFNVLQMREKSQDKEIL